MLAVEILWESAQPPADAAQLAEGVRRAAAEGGVAAGSVRVRVLDDAAIRVLHARHLAHDCPTDVLSFRLSEEGEPLDGDLAVSAETAAREAPQWGWRTDAELLLYVVHGALHLVDYDDQDDASRAEMRAAERRVLAQFGLTPPIS